MQAIVFKQFSTLRTVKYWAKINKSALKCLIWYRILSVHIAFFRIKGSLEHSNIFRKLDRLKYFVWKQFCEDFVSFEKHFIEKSVSLNFENLNTISSPRLWVQTLSSASLLSRKKVSNKVVKNYVKNRNQSWLILSTFAWFFSPFVTYLQETVTKVLNNCY